jgi:hypothetical protein
MRTKTLLLTAALSAAGLVSSMGADTLSVNSVGYVNASVPAATQPAPGQGGAPSANKLAILSIPLNGMDGGAINNNVTNTVKLPDPGSDGALIYRFDVPTQNYLEAIQWFDGFGWFTASPTAATDMIINPGEGFWLSNPNPTLVPLVFTGEVPMGAALPNAIPANPRLKLASSVVPIGNPLGGTDQVIHGNPRQTLYFPALDGDIAYIWDVGIQNYKEAYQYFAGFGWFSPNLDDPGPNGPVIPVGSGFWIQKGQDANGNPNPAVNWNQSYSVADGYNYNL